MAYNTFTPIVTDGIVLYIDASNTRSYDGSGTSSYNLKDGSTGELLNGVGFDNSFTFDGVDDYINFVDSVNLDGFSEFTLSAWVYINSFSTYNAIFHKWGSGGYAYFLGVWNILGDYKVVAGENYTGYQYGDVSNSAIYTNKWYHITYTSTISTRSCYINGVLDKSEPNTWRSINIIDSAYDLKIATHADGFEYTNCKINNAIIYNRELTASEVSQNYNALKNRFIYE